MLALKFSDIILNYITRTLFCRGSSEVQGQQWSGEVTCCARRVMTSCHAGLRNAGRAQGNS